MSKRSRISLWPGWDTLSAVSDAHRLVNTLASAHPHERPRSLVLVRVLAPALRADVHTLRLHNTTLRRDDSEVPRGQTREYLGPTPARGFPDWPRAPFSNPSIHRAIPRAPGTFGDRVSPRFQTAYVSGPPIGLQTGGAATTHLSGHHRLSPVGPPYHQRRQGHGELPIAGCSQTRHPHPGSRPPRETTIRYIWFGMGVLSPPA